MTMFSPDREITPELEEISYVYGFSIINRRAEQITQEEVNNYQYGNTHEFVHLFFSGTPIIRGWFEEGLADYMENTQQGNKNLFCRESGWETGYYDYNGNFVSNSGLISYSDFTIIPEVTAEFYDSLNLASYYTSAECFWIHVKDIYGKEAIENIAKTWHNTRKILPPKEKYLIRDIVNPVLGASLSSLVYERYNYIEE